MKTKSNKNYIKTRQLLYFMSYGESNEAIKLNGQVSNIKLI